MFFLLQLLTGFNQVTLYGTFNSSTFIVPSIPANYDLTNVTFYVDRVAPDGIASDVGYIIWYLDGNQMDIQYFTNGDMVQKYYTMSVNRDSVVVVTVGEG